MCKLGNTRPLPGHSSIGSINTRNKLHSGVHPPTTESNKGGSVSVIWQNQARRLPEVHPEYSATASGRGSNGRRASSLLVRLVQGEVRWEAPDHSQSVLPQNWGRTEQNLTVICMVLKAKANNRRKILALHRDVFRGPSSDQVT
ncbi:hypothetical protein TNCV_3869791 [Trichonephila clavipes]|nr:hypothetical protein TNCV_3869791 [Trichonephila clavipes]